MLYDLPDDENGDTLRRMALNGDDLERPRDIDFSLIFPGELEAKAFASLVRRPGIKATVHLSNCVPELPWDVTVTKHMVPTHANITAFEQMLEGLALPYRGRNDGWGCFSEPAQN